MMRQSVFTKRPEDPFAVYLDMTEFGVAGDGVHDDTKGIQAAINWLKEKRGFGIVIVPEGTYKITDTIYVPKAIRLIGFGKTRPKFILADHAPGYNREYPGDKGNAKYMIWFTHKLPEPGEKEQDFDANPGTFYSALSNIDIEIGRGNTNAIALRTHYAQHSFISHCFIDVGDAKAGIFDVGNVMEDVHIRGGQYGIITTKCSPGWPFVMIDTSFKGQKKAAIKSREAGLTIIRTKVSDTPKFLTVDDDYWEKLYLEDSILENISDAAIEISCENNVFSQYNIRNVSCIRTKNLAVFKESGKVIKGRGDAYHIRRFVHGLQKDLSQGDYSICTTVEIDELNETNLDISPDMPALPNMETWVNIRDLGAKGDGITDDTKIFQKAIENYDTIYVPQGQYVVSDTIRLKKDTKLIGLTPIGTRIVLLDNTESFAGCGQPKAVLETPEDGQNIISGIGIDTGGKNPRAVGCKWMSGKSSCMNDVKFFGGHGNMDWDTGMEIPPYDDLRLRDYYADRKWDSQYWSLWITNNGGGVFKNIWSANPYAVSGLYVSSTNSEGRIYAISLEHHVRAEAILNNVKNWKFYGLQTEEEKVEGEDSLPLLITDCQDLLFANLYLFRVVMVEKPKDHAVKTVNSRNIEFLNVHNYAQTKFSYNNTIYDESTGLEVRPWELARFYLRENVFKPFLMKDQLKYRVEKVASGFEFIDGITSDGSGNVYFCDSRLKQIYHFDLVKNIVRPLLSTPFKPRALACDTNGWIIVVCEYETPVGATKNGETLLFTKPEDAEGSSYAYYYPDHITLSIYSFDPKNPEETITPLKKTKRENISCAERIIYPGHRWRDAKDFEKEVMRIPDEVYLGKDHKTIIPDCYDLMRCSYLAVGRPDEIFYAVDEYYKRTYQFAANERCEMIKMNKFAEKGELCSIQDAEGRVFICDDQIYVFDRDGHLLGKVFIPERPATLVPGGDDILYVTGRETVYKVTIEV